jgi:hypothetical protein
VVGAGLVAVVTSDGVAAGRLELGDGAAWLPSSAAGEVVLIDGTTGRVVARVDGVGAGPLEVAQAGAGALVASRDAEAAFRVSGEALGLAALDGDKAGVRFPGVEQVEGASVAYVRARCGDDPHRELPRCSPTGADSSSISVAANTSLVSLSLTSNELSGPIPAALGSLEKLANRYLEDNALSGAIPAELGNLSNMSQFVLINNKLSGPVPPELQRLDGSQIFRLGPNGCLTAATPALRTWLESRDPTWDSGCP